MEIDRFIESNERFSKIFNFISSKMINKFPLSAKFLKDLNKGYVTLMYHTVLKKNDDYKYNIKPKYFKSQIEYLSDDLEIVSTKELINDIKSNTEPSQLKIVLTFDDGDRSNYDFVYPYLKELSIPATFFVYTDGIEDKEKGKSDKCISWPELREISNHELFEIGSHGLTHSSLTDMTEKEMKKEISMSKEILEDNLSEEINTIAYPFGDFDERVIKETKRAGYELGFTCEPGIFTFQSNPLKFGRYAITNSPIIDI